MHSDRSSKLRDPGNHISSEITPRGLSTPVGIGALLHQQLVVPSVLLTLYSRTNCVGLPLLCEALLELSAELW
jgi:hypothetical protein